MEWRRDGFLSPKVCAEKKTILRESPFDSLDMETVSVLCDYCLYIMKMYFYRFLRPRTRNNVFFPRKFDQVDTAYLAIAVKRSICIIGSDWPYTGMVAAAAVRPSTLWLSSYV